MSIVTATDDSTPVGVTSLQRRVRRWLTSTGRGGFVVLVVVFVIDVVVFSSLFGSRDPGRGMDWLIVPAIGAIGVALLAWRRRAPVLCYFAVWVHSIATQLIVPDYHPTVGLWVALAAVAQARSMWISLPLVALTFVPESFAIMQSGDQEEAQYRTSAITISIIAYGLFNCFAWAIGRWAARASARLDASEERRKADIAAERLQAEQAVADERLRLARELHDIVAHAVTIMIIHSATASRLIHRDPSAAEEALDIVHLAGQQAVDELHRMLGLLRAVGSSAGLDADLPTLSDLPALVERTRAGGLKVELTSSGQPTSLDPSVQLAGYRVVQETLTNALKYSGVGSQTTVDLGWTDQKLIITVQDDGKGLVSDGVMLPSNGRGLIGLRERVSIAGGSLTAGPTEGGGFLVSAELPASNDRAHRSSNASG